jgi:hypothetical protein
MSPEITAETVCVAGSRGGAAGGVCPTPITSSSVARTFVIVTTSVTNRDAIWPFSEKPQNSNER